MSSNNGTTPTTVEPEVVETPTTKTTKTTKGTKYNPRDRYTTRTTTTDAGDRVRRAKAKHSGNLVKRLARLFVLVVTAPVRFLIWLTEPPGSAIPLAFGTVYMMLVNVEGYWQSASPLNPAFLPKPFINDGADFSLFFTVAIWDGSFWIAFILSACVQIIQAKLLRDAKTAREAVLKAKAEYEAVRQFEVEPGSDSEIAIAREKRKSYQQAGMKGVRMRAASSLITYAIDIAVAIWNFPVLAQRGAQLAINAVWSVASVFGAETMICWFLDSLEEGKELIRRVDEQA